MHTIFTFNSGLSSYLSVRFVWPPEISQKRITPSYPAETNTTFREDMALWSSKGNQNQSFFWIAEEGLIVCDCIEVHCRGG